MIKTILILSFLFMSVATFATTKTNPEACVSNITLGGKTLTLVSSVCQSNSIILHNVFTTRPSFIFFNANPMDAYFRSLP